MLPRKEKKLPRLKYIDRFESLFYSASKSNTITTQIYILGIKIGFEI